jgi:hypothetical protein
VIRDFVISGGWLVRIFTVDRPFEFVDRPILSPLGSGWEAQFRVPALSTGVVIWDTHAICFDNPPPH